MPPKGGNPDLENIEVERAVVFMANKAGANWKAAPPAATAPGAERTGEEVVSLVCAKCHATGERGAPKIGDRAAWTPRVAKGLATVTQAALKGHGGMPARAGMAELSDTEIKRAVEYMLNSGLVKPTRGGGSALRPRGGRRARGAASRTARRSTTRRARSATAPASPARRSSATRPRGRRASRPASTRSTRARSRARARCPPKGGNASLSDADVKAAVDYMVAAAQVTGELTDAARGRVQSPARAPARRASGIGVRVSPRATSRSAASCDR